MTSAISIGFAALVVHLEVLAVVRAGAQRHLRGESRRLAIDVRVARPAGVERVRPVEALLAHRALVVAEQDEHARLIGWMVKKPMSRMSGTTQMPTMPTASSVTPAASLAVATGASDAGRHGGSCHDARDEDRRRHRGQQQHRPAASHPDGLLDGCRPSATASGKSWRWTRSSART